MAMAKCPQSRLVKTDTESWYLCEMDGCPCGHPSTCDVCLKIEMEYKGEMQCQSVLLKMPTVAEQGLLWQ